MVILLTIMCSVVIFFLVLIISYNLGLKNNWKRKRIESVKNVGDTPRKKQLNQEKKSIKERYKQYLKSSKNINACCIDCLQNFESGNGIFDSCYGSGRFGCNYTAGRVSEGKGEETKRVIASAVAGYNGLACCKR